DQIVFFTAGGFQIAFLTAGGFQIAFLIPSSVSVLSADASTASMVPTDDFSGAARSLPPPAAAWFAFARIAITFRQSDANSLWRVAMFGVPPRRSVWRMNSRSWISPSEKLLLMRMRDRLPPGHGRDNARIAM